MKKLTVQELDFPCDYHPNDMIKKSTENPNAWICSSCKKEKVEGRDGIYDKSELIKLISKKCENAHNDRRYIRDETWELFRSNK